MCRSRKLCECHCMYKWNKWETAFLEELCCVQLQLHHNDENWLCSNLYCMTNTCYIATDQRVFYFFSPCSLCGRGLFRGCCVSCEANNVVLVCHYGMLGTLAYTWFLARSRMSLTCWMQRTEDQMHNAHGMIEADCGLILSSDSTAQTSLLFAFFISAVKPPRC